SLFSDSILGPPSLHPFPTRRSSDLLCFGLRGVRKALRVMLPVYAAIAMTVACLGLLGIGLSLFHLVSLLLVLGIGLNYSLFFSQDRKSTRLNSSHQIISYAVFWLNT